MPLAAAGGRKASEGVQWSGLPSWRGTESGMEVTWWFGMATVAIVVETGLIVWLIRDRAARRRAGHRLKNSLRFEALLADLSAKLIHVETRNLEAALGTALQQAVSFLGMDRGS